VIRARRSAAVAGVVLVLALLSSNASNAGSRTTQPGKNALVYFVLNDRDIVVQIFRSTPNVSGGVDLFPERYLVRGDYATFYAVNRGKKRHGVVFLGKKVASLKPGQKVRLLRRPLLIRGGFPYRSTTDPGKAFKGVFRVY
jgi:hypothetical protein